MAANRKLPFGYAMQMGKICIQEQEARLVREIFSDYIRGASFLQLAEKLNIQPVPYNLQTRWDKNMVARILQDERYTGEKGFPQVIGSELLNAALARRIAKQITSRPTELQKALRRMSGQKATLQVEQVVQAILDRLCREPEQVQTPDQTACPEEEIHLRRELDALMGQQPLEEDNAKITVYALAAARLNAIGSEEYETLRIREVLAKREERGTPPHDLLKSIASAVLIRPNGLVELRLKNGQIIKGRTTL